MEAEEEGGRGRKSREEESEEAPLGERTECESGLVPDTDRNAQ
jgi:hypothetical protein